MWIYHDENMYYIQRKSSVYIRGYNMQCYCDRCLFEFTRRQYSWAMTPLSSLIFYMKTLDTGEQIISDEEETRYTLTIYSV